MIDSPVKLTVGGDVQAEDGTYLYRPADNELFEVCRTGKFAYVLACRQIGKSSLKNAVAERLLAEGIRVARIDLNRIGQNVKEAEIWYFTLLDEIARNLQLKTDIEAWWESQPQRLSLTQRFLRFLEEVVLTEISEPVVIFVDEIDMTLGLPFTNDFFAAIRVVYNDRAQHPTFRRLTFVLLGVATPDELINDHNRTPFNIGEAITMRDFTLTECEPLYQAIEAKHPGKGMTYFQQIYNWTNGHPYLTQKLCAILLNTPPEDNPNLIEDLVRTVFLTEKERLEGNLRFVQDRVVGDPQSFRILQTYKKILQGEKVSDDEKSPIINRLKLYGLVIPEAQGVKVRNNIYAQAFDLNWVQANIPTYMNTRYRSLAIALSVVILILVVSLASLAWIAFVPGEMPLNTFNVAVAEFGQVDAQGNVSSSEDGRKLSEQLFNELQAEHINWRPLDTSSVTIWHDSMGFAEKRTKIGTISGYSYEERAKQANIISQEIGGDMVIYGDISVDGNDASFTPEFYEVVIRSEADEIVGLHQLGSPISVQLPIDHNQSVSGQLIKRVTRLIWFTRGLLLDLSGRHEDAFRTFREAEQNWDDDLGKETLYYYIGQEATVLSRDNPDILDEAELAFNKALAINPDYARAYVGLGNVYSQRAQYLPPEERLHNTYLDLAIKHYDRSREVGSDLAGVRVEIERHLGLGNAYRLQGDAYLSVEDIDKANRSYDTAIQELGSVLSKTDPDQHRLSAQAYLALGTIYESKAYITRYVQQDEAMSKPLYEKARAAYDHCIEHAQEEFYDSSLQELKTVYCGPYSQEVQEELETIK